MGLIWRVDVNTHLTNGLVVHRQGSCVPDRMLSNHHPGRGFLPLSFGFDPVRPLSKPRDRSGEDRVRKEDERKTMASTAFHVESAHP